jgi:hypothetical protein
MLLKVVAYSTGRRLLPSRPVGAVPTVRSSRRDGCGTGPIEVAAPSSFAIQVCGLRTVSVSKSLRRDTIEGSWDWPADPQLPPEKRAIGNMIIRLRSLTPASNVTGVTSLRRAMRQVQNLPQGRRKIALARRTVEVRFRSSNAGEATNLHPMLSGDARLDSELRENCGRVGLRRHQ